MRNVSKTPIMLINVFVEPGIKEMGLSAKV